jgi:DNA-binding SARP family transcriptional activator
MQFQILGPLRVVEGGATVAVGGARERSLLALLLLRANRVVPVAELVDALWPQQPPVTARQQVQTAVWQVRRALGEAAPPAAPKRIETLAAGYLIRVEPGELDADVFAARVAAARTRPDRAVAADELRRALALWRGPALHGVEPATVRVAAAGLDGQRLAAVEDWAEAELAAGRCGDVVAELTPLTVVHPFRERLQAALLLALYRLGRQAEALVAYRQYRNLLVSELGVEPGHQLQAVHRSILRADPVPVG